MERESRPIACQRAADLPTPATVRPILEPHLTATRANQLNGKRRHGSRAGRGRKSPKWQFLRGFLKHPVMVGSVIPSSRILIDRMLRPVDWSRTRLFVEYGPGVGTFTRPILERLGPDAMLIAIDTNPDFIDYLNGDIDDDRFIAVHGSAADVEKIIESHGFDHADYVLSGLPFSTLPPGVGDAIGAATGRAIRDG